MVVVLHAVYSVFLSPCMSSLHASPCKHHHPGLYYSTGTVFYFQAPSANWIQRYLVFEGQNKPAVRIFEGTDFPMTVAIGVHDNPDRRNFYTTGCYEQSLVRETQEYFFGPTRYWNPRARDRQPLTLTTGLTRYIFCYICKVHQMVFNFSSYCNIYL